jgi:hypothetical protein
MGSEAMPAGKIRVGADPMPARPDGRSSDGGADRADQSTMAARIEPANRSVKTKGVGACRRC